jgi:hypothetical protein
MSFQITKIGCNAPNPPKEGKGSQEAEERDEGRNEPCPRTNVGLGREPGVDCSDATYCIGFDTSRLGDVTHDLVMKHLVLITMKFFAAHEVSSDRFHMNFAQPLSIALALFLTIRARDREPLPLMRSEVEEHWAVPVGRSRRGGCQQGRADARRARQDAGVGVPPLRLRPPVRETRHAAGSSQLESPLEPSSGGCGEDLLSRRLIEPIVEVAEPAEPWQNSASTTSVSARARAQSRRASARARCRQSVRPVDVAAAMRAIATPGSP